LRDPASEAMLDVVGETNAVAAGECEGPVVCCFGLDRGGRGAAIGLDVRHGLGPSLGAACRNAPASRRLGREPPRPGARHRARPCESARRGMLRSQAMAEADDDAITGEAPPLLGGRYRVEALVASGGMGSVYRVHDLELDDTVALKIVGALDADSL